MRSDAEHLDLEAVPGGQLVEAEAAVHREPLDLVVGQVGVGGTVHRRQATQEAIVELHARVAQDLAAGR